ncbi:hypothetical protein PsYK624_077440 [Phanerochaete sordida]|uniref:Uncharacterized protein n=1 Tax=Phanerochaete sordida TaxID=48140 RepID=A0A9P3GD22_9APHY|nr:hypothetical protein PsYK624_077440 [Phanerochaete sordida]
MPASGVPPTTVAPAPPTNFLVPSAFSLPIARSAAPVARRWVFISSPICLLLYVIRRGQHIVLAGAGCGPSPSQRGPLRAQPAPARPGTQSRRQA